MKICKNHKCKKKHDGTFGGGYYCSRECANSRDWNMPKYKKVKISRIEKNKKWHSNNKGTLKYDTWKKNQAIANKNPNKINKHIEFLDKEREKSVLTGTAGKEAIRTYLIKKDGYECKHCGISEWKGESIALEFDHIDGNNQNNHYKNARLLCPNCHSQTPGFRGRKII
tara:strand:- start:83 stop:589 length:507 start_codon:yes stop_codon:yes gene_type:complete